MLPRGGNCRQPGLSRRGRLAHATCLRRVATVEAIRPTSQDSTVGSKPTASGSPRYASDTWDFGAEG
jgi:hypothetical protein